MQRNQPLLGTFVTITAFGPGEEQTQRAVSAAFAEVRRIDLLLSIHKTNSAAAIMNAAAAQRPVAISPELRFVVAKSLEVARRTDGAFDPAIGPLAHLWGFIWKEYRLPKPDELKRVLPLVDYGKVELQTNDLGETTVSFQDEEMFLDFGGIGKGYAVDCAIGVLARQGITNAMVKAGGDLRVTGTPPGAEGWEIQIEDPGKKGNRTTIWLREGALSTSGNYENYFEVEGKRYSHILDPRIGLPVQGISSCTVIAPTCLESDAYATAFFVLGINRSFHDFDREFGVHFVDADSRAHQNEQFRVLTSRP